MIYEDSWPCERGLSTGQTMWNKLQQQKHHQKCKYDTNFKTARISMNQRRSIGICGIAKCNLDKKKVLIVSRPCTIQIKLMPSAISSITPTKICESRMIHLKSQKHMRNRNCSVITNFINTHIIKINIIILQSP